MSNANLKRKIRAGIKAGRIDPNYLETRRRQQPAWAMRSSVKQPKENPFNKIPRFLQRLVGRGK